MTYKKREGGDRMMWYPLGGGNLARGHHVQHHYREHAWILEKLKETTGLVWSKQ